MSPIVWWAIPAVSTLAAIVWIRLGGRGSGRVRSRPEPGSQQDIAELGMLESALRQPWPGRADGPDRDGSASD